MEVKWDTDLYAHGCAVDNPVKISGGNNTVNVWVFSVDASEMPLISEKPQGATYAVNATAAPLKVTAKASDEWELSYQWYSNKSAGNSGGSAVTDRR